MSEIFISFVPKFQNSQFSFFHNTGSHISYCETYLSLFIHLKTQISWLPVAITLVWYNQMLIKNLKIDWRRWVFHWKRTTQKLRQDDKTSVTVFLSSCFLFGLDKTLVLSMAGALVIYASLFTSAYYQPIQGQGSSSQSKYSNLLKWFKIYSNLI